MPWLSFTRLALGLAPSAAPGGEHGGGASSPEVFAVRLKSIHGKEWQERRNFRAARLQHRASRLPRGSAGTGGNGVMGSCSPPPRVLSQKSAQLHALGMPLPPFRPCHVLRPPAFPCPGFLTPMLPSLDRCPAPPPSVTPSLVLPPLRGCLSAIPQTPRCKRTRKSFR